jgi:hypothetical protein
MKNIETKVSENFNQEFQMSIVKVEVSNGIANVLAYENNTWYACLVNKNGVKKNSWRMQ